MKKIRFLAFFVLVLAACLGFTACENMATLIFINDTNETQVFVLKHSYVGDYKWIDINLDPSKKWEMSSANELTYAVYRSRLNTAGWYIWQGTIAAGETVEHKFSEAQR